MFVCFIKEGGPVGMPESILTSQISILSGIGWTQKTHGQEIGCGGKGTGF